VTRKFTCNLSVCFEVEVEIVDPDVLARVVENKDGWRETFYAFQDAEQVVHHIACNFALNGWTIERLYGWADLPPSAVRVRMLGHDADSEVEEIRPRGLER